VAAARGSGLFINACFAPPPEKVSGLKGNKKHNVFCEFA
jgi:hypothetical protein